MIPNAYLDARGWIRTSTGQRFDVQNPDPTSINIRDIAHALSMVCRFGGHVHRFYSVAQHCVLVSQHVSRPLRLTALLHDAGEAYTGDMPSPIKAVLPDFQVLERRVDQAIAEHFGLPSLMTPEIKRIDRRILIDEVNSVFPNHGAAFGQGNEPLGINIDPLVPAESEALFLDRFAELTQL